MAAVDGPLILVRQADSAKGEQLSPKIKCGYYDRATPEKFFGVSLAYVRSLESSQKCIHIPDNTRSCPACIHYFCLISCTKRIEIVPKLTTSQRTCAVQRRLCIVF